MGGIYLFCQPGNRRGLPEPSGNPGCLQQSRRSIQPVPAMGFREFPLGYLAASLVQRRFFLARTCFQLLTFKVFFSKR